MSKHPDVSHIEEDLAVRRSNDIIREESDATVPWNLDRLDQRGIHLDQCYHPNGDGRGVDVYVVDTGVRATHKELEGRVQYSGFDAIDNLTGSQNHGEDCNGHGTHCAGIIAGKIYGVAKNATIYNMRALNCNGTGAVTGIVMAIDKIMEHKNNNRNGRPTVISLSLAVWKSNKSESLNRAITEATNAGITCFSAAGNDGDNSCNYSPANTIDGITVGATDRNDKVTDFTNTGECTTIMAPGFSITSASNKCDTCTKTMSGTSMAAPHAAGYAAIMLSQNPQMTPAEVKEKMITQSTKGKLIMSGPRSHLTPNRLLYIGNVNNTTKSYTKCLVYNIILLFGRFNLSIPDTALSNQSYQEFYFS